MAFNKLFQVYRVCLLNGTVNIRRHLLCSDFFLEKKTTNKSLNMSHENRNEIWLNSEQCISMHVKLILNVSNILDVCAAADAVAVVVVVFICYSCIFLFRIIKRCHELYVFSIHNNTAFTALSAHHIHITYATVQLQLRSFLFQILIKMPGKSVT